VPAPTVVAPQQTFAPTYATSIPTTTIGAPTYGSTIPTTTVGGYGGYGAPVVGGYGGFGAPAVGGYGGLVGTSTIV
jgi:hypothetical protein